MRDENEDRVSSLVDCGHHYQWKARRQSMGNGESEEGEIVRMLHIVGYWGS